MSRAELQFAAVLLTRREQAQQAACDAFLAGVSMSWLPLQEVAP